MDEAELSGKEERLPESGPARDEGEGLPPYVRKKRMKREQYEDLKARMRDYSVRKRKELAIVRERVVMIYEELVRLGVYHRLSDEAREFMDVYVKRKKLKENPYPPTMYKMFEGKVELGASCTLREAMLRLYKGQNEINFLVRRWRDRHGVHIELEPDENGDALGAKYVIRRIDRKDDDGKGYEIRDMLGKTEMLSMREMESLER